MADETSPGQPSEGNPPNHILNLGVILRSLVMKGAMLGIAAVVLFWVGWPMPDRPMRAAPGMTIQGSLEASRSDATSRIRQPDKSAEPLEPSGGDLALLDINRATREELRSLPGIGPVLSKRILERRTATGAFHAVDELLDVRGIGYGRLKRIRPYVTVDHTVSPLHEDS